jgi:hypothetical protein
MQTTGCAVDGRSGHHSVLDFAAGFLMIWNDAYYPNLHCLQTRAPSIVLLLTGNHGQRGLFGSDEDAPSDNQNFKNFQK